MMGSIQAQESPEDPLTRYQHENAVVLVNKEHLEIDLKGGQITAVSTVEQEIQLLSDLAPSMFNNSNVYHSFFHKVDKQEGYTLLPDKKGFKKLRAREFKTVKSTSEGVFYDDVHETIISYSGLVKGARTLMTYEMTHTDPHFLPPFNFQTNLPVVLATFSVTAPKEIIIDWQLRGLHGDRIRQTQTETRGKITYTWTAHHLPRPKGYSNAPSPSYFMPHLLVYIREYPGKKGGKERIFGTVDDLYRFYSSFLKDLNQQKDPQITSLVKELTDGISDPVRKAEKIYQWVQEHIRYVAFEDGMGGFIPRPASLVCSRKYGDCKDMSSLLVTTFREAGIEAYYTWIGTRHKPYRYEETPLPIADNHMIATIRINDQWIFVDGTNSFIPFGVPPSSIQGKQALVGMGEKYKVLDVPVQPAAANLIYDSTHVVLDGRSLKGDISFRAKGYPAWRLHEMFLYRNEKEKSDAIKSMLSRGSNKFLQESYTLGAVSNTEKTFEAGSRFEISDYVHKAGKEWYINLNLDRSFEDLQLDDPERNVPFENSYKHKVRQVVVLDIPEGLEVSWLPPASVMKEKDLWNFRIGYEQKGSQVHLTKEFEMNTLYIQPSSFPKHKTMMDELRKQYKESIVLKEK